MINGDKIKKYTKNTCRLKEAFQRQWTSKTSFPIPWFSNIPWASVLFANSALLDVNRILVSFSVVFRGNYRVMTTQSCAVAYFCLPVQTAMSFLEPANFLRRMLDETIREKHSATPKDQFGYLKCGLLEPVLSWALRFRRTFCWYNRQNLFSHTPR